MTQVNIYKHTCTSNTSETNHSDGSITIKSKVFIIIIINNASLLSSVVMKVLDKTHFWIYLLL